MPNYASTGKNIWDILETVTDPEIPVLSIIDLGIVRSLSILPHENIGEKAELILKITPTYSACPAVDMIQAEILATLNSAGYHRVSIEEQLSPAWTTDWLSEKAKEKLTAYGIAAPVGKNCSKSTMEDLELSCPQCGSKKTQLISEFGSTACKALFKCLDCAEPFDYFKCH